MEARSSFNWRMQTPTFEFTPKQREAMSLLASPAKHILLVGGSRSGKTFLFTRAVIARALKAPKSRHAILRFRFNHVKASIGLDTYPKVMQLCFPGLKAEFSRTDWYAVFPNGSEIWLGGLDDKERTEKILGSEFATLYLNECSQIPYASRNMAMTRLAQRVYEEIEGKPSRPLQLKCYLDENPPSKAHWSYKLFVEGRDAETRQLLPDREQYAWMQMNPVDNTANLPSDYIDSLKTLPARFRLRFLEGQFAEANPNALFSSEDIEKWRVLDGRLPDMQRLVVAVDPSGSGDEDNADNDEIGIVVAGLGTDGNGYLLEDLTVKAGPKTWGNIATTAYERHAADVVVGEVNYGGAMVKHVIQTARPRTPYKEVRASRGKVVRAEPISALVEQGKIRHVGNFSELEDELCAMTTFGYTGQGSPNRGDAYVWAFSELFPGIVRTQKEPALKKQEPRFNYGSTGWMGA